MTPWVCVVPCGLMAAMSVESSGNQNQRLRAPRFRALDLLEHPTTSPRHRSGRGPSSGTHCGRCGQGRGRSGQEMGNLALQYASAPRATAWILSFPKDLSVNQPANVGRIPSWSQQFAHINYFNYRLAKKNHMLGRKVQHDLKMHIGLYR